jgi:hypothetical protein
MERVLYVTRSTPKEEIVTVKYTENQLHVVGFGVNSQRVLGAVDGVQRYNGAALLCIIVRVLLWVLMELVSDKWRVGIQKVQSYTWIIIN